MSFKLIGMIILLVLVTVFCGFNNGDGYRCNVNLLFRTFNDVPVFLTVLVSFLAGAVVALPFTFGRRAKKQPKAPAAEKADKPVKAKKAAAGNAGAAGSAVQPSSDISAGSAAEAQPYSAASVGAAQAGAATAGTSDAAKVHDGACSPFKAALENARARRAQKKQEKAAAAKKAADAQKTPSPNDVPKAYPSIDTSKL